MNFRLWLLPSKGKGKEIFLKNIFRPDDDNPPGNYNGVSYIRAKRTIKKVSIMCN